MCIWKAKRTGLRSCRSVQTTKTAEQNTMKRIKQTLLIAALTCLALSSTRAQDNNSSDSNNNNNAGRRRGGFGGDPAQFQQQMMERTRERLEVKDDAEWKALEPLVQKVMDVRRDMFSMAARGFGQPRVGEANAGDNKNRRGGFGPPSPNWTRWRKPSRQ